MTVFRGGSRAAAGFYWRPLEWEILSLRADGETLPGATQERLYRLGPVATLLVAPLMGGLFVVFLPVAGVLVVLRVACAAAWRRLPRRPAQLASKLRLAVRPRLGRRLEWRRSQPPDR